jgi:hypothetical protein
MNYIDVEISKILTKPKEIEINGEKRYEIEVEWNGWGGKGKTRVIKKTYDEIQRVKVGDIIRV